MSQIPSRIPRARGFPLQPLQRQGIAQPTIAVPAAHSSTAQAAQDLLGVLRGAHGLATAVTQDKDRRRREDDRVKVDDRALFTRIARTDLAGDRVNIATLAEAWDPGEMKAEDFALQVAGERLAGDNRNDTQRNAYLQSWLPGFVGLLHEHHAGQRTKATGESLALLRESFFTADTPERFGDLLTEVSEDPRFQHLSEQDRFSALVVPALKAAAQDGRPETRANFDAAMATLGDRFPSVTRPADAVRRASESRYAGEQIQDADQRYAALRMAGVPVEELRDFRDNDPRLDDKARLRITEKINAMERADNREAQQQSGNALARDIFLRRWVDDSPVATVNEIVRRMDIADHDDPDFISADRGRQLLSELQTTVTFDARLHRVQTIFGGITQPAEEGQQPAAQPVLTAADDGALLRYLADTGVVEGIHDGQTAVLHRIHRPLAFAEHVAAVNRLPSQAAQMIAAGLTSPDEAQQLEAATAWAAVYIQSPHLAMAVEMTPEAAIRARYIAARQAQLGRADSDAHLRSNLTFLMREASALKPIDITDQQVAGLVFWRDPNHKSATDNREVHHQARKSLGSAVKDSHFWQELDRWSRHAPGFAGGITIANAPADAVNRFRQILTEEYRFARSISPSEPAAAASARRWAMERTLSEFPPLAWNGRVYWTRNQDLPTTPHLQDTLRKDLLSGPEEFAAGRREFVNDLMANFVPVWDSTQGGFMFYSVDDPFIAKTIWDQDQVGPLVVTLDPPKSAVEQALDGLARGRGPSVGEQFKDLGVHFGARFRATFIERPEPQPEERTVREQFQDLGLHFWRTSPLNPNRE